MRNRWFHPPLLHTPSEHVEKKATWLELFYDLVFVAAFIQLGNGLAANVSVQGAATFGAVFVALWVAWSGVTFYKNRYTIDDFLHRITIFLQMFAVGGMALAAPLVLEGKVMAFAISAGIAQVLVALMYLRAHQQVPESRAYAKYWGLIFFFSGVGWIASAWMPSPYYGVVWAAATLTVLAAPLSPQSRALGVRFPIDFEHLGERYGLLTIIVLGESFVKVLSALAAENLGIGVYVETGVVLIITCGLWWVYFDDVAGATIRKGPADWVIWLYAHVTLPIGFVAVGVALKKAVHFGFDVPAPSAYRWLLCGALALAYFSVAAIDSVSDRQQAELSDRARVNVRWMSAVFLLVLAPAGGAMSGGMFLVMVTAVTVAQVVFDMAMAPFEAAEHLEIGQRSIAEVAKAPRESRDATQPRRDITEAVRKGAPQSLRRDLYFYFMEGSWTRIFVAFSLLFVVSNIFFAALFLIEPGSIANADPRSFSDAFFFSVQSMSTIGYGGMSPDSDYANAVVTVQAALSIVTVAIVTGLMFAKASKPKSSVLFSKPLVVTDMNGKRTLSFRVGNARGNEVVDATIDLTVLCDEVTPEGHHLRRLHDLKLVRRRSPMFVLSWSVMHVIDEDSPLANVDWNRPDDFIGLFVATLMGHDGTYGQTVFSRHIYYPEHIRTDHRFVDILSELDDGRLLIDFTHFHETESEAQVDSNKNG